MNKIKDVINHFGFNVRGYQKKGNIKILDTDQGKYVVKQKQKNEDHLSEYLKNKNFLYLLENEVIKGYTVFPFIEEVEMEEEEKAIELVYILSLLHNKTTFYKEVSLDKVKEVYETLFKEIDYLNYYYHDLQDMIEQKVYMSPEEYLLIRNISLLYSSLNYAKETLEKWYEYKKDQKKERVVFLHGSPSLEHFLVGEDRKLISWSHSRRDIPIYDFYYFYKKDYFQLEMDALFDLYQSKFLYTQEERLLFFTMISIPKKMIFTKKHYHDCQEVYQLIKYIEKTRDFILKEDQKTEKSNHDELNK